MLAWWIGTYLTPAHHLICSTELCSNGYILKCQMQELMSFEQTGWLSCEVSLALMSRKGPARQGFQCWGSQMKQCGHGYTNLQGVRGIECGRQAMAQQKQRRFEENQDLVIDLWPLMNQGMIVDKGGRWCRFSSWERTKRKLFSFCNLIWVPWWDLTDLSASRIRHTCAFYSQIRKAETM